MTQKKKSGAKAEKTKSKKSMARRSTTEEQFPIVGIGASAGGLEALELFLANVPEKSGIAIVIVQHLDPTHKGIMVELLQRGTSMNVMQVKERTVIKPDCVYVIPPNKDMTIGRGVLHLLDPVSPRGLRLPIDFFFRTLADDQQDKSIGVILSGMGSDGTLGLRAIKEKAGVVFIQDPTSAKFSGMPHSAIEAGLADVIAPVESLPAKIIAYLHHAPLIAKSGVAIEDKSQSGLEKVVILLRLQSGHDFSLYKKSTIYRRIERRMGIHQIDKIASYVRHLQENPQEVELLFRELLIGVTSFFRDPDAWEIVRTKVLPSLISDRAPHRTLRAWVPACATGEEAYSLAILFKETIEKLKPTQNVTVQIFATDLDQHAIEKAREGIFPTNIAADMSQERLARYFVQVDRGYQVVKSIREMVIFAPQNIIMDPPFTKLDIVSCRNLLIYLTPELQKKILPLFHYSLNPGGFLFLGNAESIGSFGNLFSPVETKARLYARVETGPLPEMVEFPAAFASHAGAPQKTAREPENIQLLTEQLILQAYAPAAALTNNQGDIVFISGRTGKYLEPAAGKANWNIFAMAREGLNYQLNKAFHKALRQHEPVILPNVAVGSNGGVQRVKVTVQRIHEPMTLDGMVLIVFTDIPSPTESKPQTKPSRRTTTNARVLELERELTSIRHEAQTIREEMQSSQEELRSANEEMQSTNEELQSTNEELTTSKEEMQSMNEELQTINHELQAKVDELSRMNNDMKNLLDSTDIATLFLDNSLCVRRFTNQTSKLTRLIPSDVGRPVTDIASALLYPELTDDAREVLRTLVSVERHIETENGHWYSARILPYRTLENIIDGVVVTFADITASKKIEFELRTTEARLRTLLDENGGR